MAIIKCKMCGGQLNIEPDSSVCECEYCGSKQTIPHTDDEKRLKLYERANRLRFDSEFDKAAGVYETIVGEYQEEAEAYWGLVLCKYGIEYVDDPATAKKIPTCHRSSFDSVMDNPNFDLVMENADAVARSVYREEAKQIEEIRKGIIEVSSTEEPYDIFICYKETDDKGERTIDSVIAQDVYNELMDKGYRVFFSRISLEDKLGQEYEPYIFAALNSAKVMLAFGTSYDYYNAVWVKNEWSRFLKLIAEGQKKTLIPCFKDIDAYDMPKEFKHLQAQDMGKVGAVQDLVRGIDKIFGKDKKVVASVLATGSTDYSSDVLDAKNQAQLKRGFIALEDEEWKDANAFFEEVLNYNAECAEAYLGKFLAKEKSKSLEEYYKGWIHKISATTDKMALNGSMVDRSVACEIDDELIESIIKKYSVKRADATGLSEKEIRKRFVFDRNYTSYHSSLVSYKERFLKGIEEDKQFSRARAYAGENLKANISDVISGFETYFNERISQEETERHQKEESIKKSYKKYVDSVAEDIKKEYEEYNEKRLSDFTAIKQSARDYIEEINNPGIAQMESCLRELKTYDDMSECDAVAADLSKELKYRNAILMVDNNAWSSAKIHFEELKDYKESAALLRKCDLRIARDKAEKEEQERQAKLQQEEKERKERAEKARRKKKRRKIIISIVVVIFLIAAGVLGTIFYFIPEAKYKEAVKKFNNEEYEEAIALFEGLDGYKDSKAKITESEELEYKEDLYLRAKNNGDAEYYQVAIDFLEEITPYKDSEVLLKQYKYEYGECLVQKEDFAKAIEQFEELGDYKESKDYIEFAEKEKDKLSKYEEAVDIVNQLNDNLSAYSEEKYEKAKAILEELGDYKDSERYLGILNNCVPHSIDDIAEVVVGDSVKLGLYNEKTIMWCAVAKIENKILLVSTNTVSDEKISYTENEVDSWFEQFESSCFSESEKEIIIEMTLLTRSESEEYLEPQKLLSIYDDNGNLASWWLKSSNGITYAAYGGKYLMSSYKSGKRYIRPAMWIKLQ
jgi:hypothetical protein